MTDKEKNEIYNDIDDLNHAVADLKDVIKNLKEEVLGIVQKLFPLRK